MWKYRFLVPEKMKRHLGIVANRLSQNICVYDGFFILASDRLECELLPFFFGDGVGMRRILHVWRCCFGVGGKTKRSF